MFEELENNLNYFFKNKKLLEEALTHPSMSAKQKKRFNYQRLEFLGDSILSFVIAEYLFKKFPDETEGFLSKKKAVLVSKYTLSEIAKSIQLGNFLILTKGEEKTGGRENINNLEDTIESIIGGVFLDSNIEIAKNLILRLWDNFLNLDLIDSYKTELQEWTQKYYKTLPSYTIEKIEIIDKLEIFTIKLTVANLDSITLSGHNTKHIEKELAKQMLKKIKDN